jgi:hypothetical protein
MGSVDAVERDFDVFRPAHGLANKHPLRQPPIWFRAGLETWNSSAIKQRGINRFCSLTDFDRRRYGDHEIRDVNEPDHASNLIGYGYDKRAANVKRLDGQTGRMRISHVKAMSSR